MIPTKLFQKLLRMFVGWWIGEVSTDDYKDALTIANWPDAATDEQKEEFGSVMRGAIKTIKTK